ncbi:hypothetical protein [Coleofasciculus sp. FACHB-1120]|uniref:hypothetical protein n=1 Tax=Coleofasciculus sp. FACHB-1120 TaxID=2692783 RepID=UPI001682AD66|nr:hypothetical protein [Coleofasciculus sp. FACHB-1120]MBD2743658.1 hypothetical protein [Coleofasciculus sp. FACHB-1120]
MIDINQFQRGIYREEYAPYKCGELDHANFEQRHLKPPPPARGVFFYPARSVTGTMRWERSLIIRSLREEAPGRQIDTLYVRD